MTSPVLSRYSTARYNLNLRAQEFVPNTELQPNEQMLMNWIENSWGDEYGEREWGEQTYSDNHWEFEVNRMSAIWGDHYRSPCKTQHQSYGPKKKKLSQASQRRCGWEDKANFLSSIWSQPYLDEQYDNLAFAYNSGCPRIAKKQCTASLHALLEDALQLKIQYTIITDFLLAYIMIKPANDEDYFKQSDLKQVCLPFWGPVMAEHGCPIRVRYIFDRIRENVEWAKVCSDFHSNVEVLWVGTVCRFVPTESLHISPAPGNGATTPGNVRTYAKDNRKSLDLSPIIALEYLENVVLHALPIVDISKLVGLRQLRELNLSKTLVENFAPLSEIISLERLDIHGTTFSDLAYLPSSNLTSLRVNDTNVRDLSSLVFCQKLSLLELSGCPVQNIESLAVLRSLKYLYLSKTAVFDIYPLSAIATLKFLDLSYTCVSDVHALGISLTRHKSLEYVNLEGTAVTDFSPLRSICVIGKSVEDSTEEWGSIK